MGVIYSYLVSDFANAPQIAGRSWDPSVGEAELVQKVIGIDPLQSLEQILCGEDSGAAYWGGNDPAVCFAEEEGGAFVIRLPRRLVERLSALLLSNVPEVAALWTASDSFAG